MSDVSISSLSASSTQPHRAMRRSTTASEIKDLILTRALRPGDPLPTEAELCDTLGVSRSSVREAIRALSTLDIVQVRHGQGTFVGEMSLDPMVEALVFRGVLSPEGPVKALQDIVEVRMALDLALADTIVEHASSDAFDELSGNVAEMIAHAERGESFLEADRAFHTQLLSVTENRLLEQLVGAFWDIHTAVLPLLDIPVSADMLQTAKAHDDMLQAAQAGDADAFRKAVVDHYEPLQRVLVESQRHRAS